MADIRAELTVEIFFVLQVIQVNHLGQYNCIQTNASLYHWAVGSALISAIIIIKYFNILLKKKQN